jgi:hypothetical protein
MVRPEREGVMLAYPIDEGRIARLGPTFFVQPKINGERCRVENFHGEPILLSSYGNEFQFLDHLKEAIKRVWLQVGPVPFDGEIYVHGWPRERIDSALRRTVNVSPEVGELEYHIFDLTGEKVDQAGRFWVLDEVAQRSFFDEPLRFVRPHTADFDTWRIAAQEFVDQGYEGVILRSMTSLYVPKRSVSMLKYKPTEQDEYEIVHCKEAIDKHGEPKDTLGSFLVKGSETDVFYVGAGKLTHPERDSIWKRREEVIGKMLVVKHEKIRTSGGVPLCAVAVEVKE